MARADKDDLESALLSSVEGSQNDELRSAIESALPCDVGGTRLNFPIMTAWMTRNIFDKDLNIGMQSDH